MDFTRLGLVVVTVLVTALVSVGSVAIAKEIHEPGEWSEWWSLESSDANFDPRYDTSVRRIYDQENRLVCWVVRSSSDLRAGVAIDCQPSLELGHPASY